MNKLLSGLILSSMIAVTVAVLDVRQGDTRAAFAASNALPSLLNERTLLPADEFISRLKSVHDDAGVSNAEKREIAYVLARALQKKLTGTGASKVGGAGGADSKEIIALYEEASGIAPLFERCQWQMCELATRLDDEQLMRSSCEAIIGRTKSKKTRTLAQYAIAQSFTRSKELDKANALFLAIRKESPGSPQALGSGYYLAEAQLSRCTEAAPSPEGLEEILGYFREYIRLSANGRFSINIATRMEQLSKQGLFAPTADDRETLGQVYFANGRWSDALSQWELAGPDVRPFSKSICLTNLKRYDEAKAMLLKGIKLNPESKNYVNAATQLANPLTRDQTTQLWRDILALNPKHADAPLWHIGTRVSPVESASYFKRLLKNTPTSEFAPESAWWLFWNDVRDGHKQIYPRALETARDAIIRYPQTKATARLAFWSGKLYERLGDKALARKSYELAVQRFPNSYYAFRSEHRLKALATKIDAGWTTRVDRSHPNKNWTWPQPQLAQSEAEMVEKYGEEFAILAKLGQYDECLEILPATAPPGVRSWLFALDGSLMSAIGAAGKHVSGSPKAQPVWEMSYPLAFAPFVAQNASEKSVDPLLVHALVREESRYNYKALSRSNALGLMQLLPGTAYGVAKRIGVPLSSQQDILIPEVNIKLGTDYLAYAIKRMNGNCLLAVASYNGGPNAVQGWMKKFTAAGGTDFDVFVENIPFRETRDYVRKVFGSYWAYEHIYAANRPGT
ncbi:MAG: transglycosylase SLT domain-containing protein [Candidatus Obscuribacterales bacterium]|nr:transglycosylase SLT domain-containing protein [Candidatus Obscuribacterales bacterium]